MGSPAVRRDFGAAEVSAANTPLHIHTPESKQTQALSPSIQQIPGEQIAAFELKFLVDRALASAIQQWAERNMESDAFADPEQGGSYQTTTLYLDTPNRDVLRRASGHRTRKYRLRRYGSDDRIFLERKTRRGDRVSKRRSDVLLDELGLLSNQSGEEWSGEWFRSQMARRQLHPACRITYDRTAFIQMTTEGPLRLTLDRQVRGLRTSTWDLTPIVSAHNILSDQVICEFKFRGTMPTLFKEVIQSLRLDVGGVSKYRRMMTAIDASESEGPTDA